MTDPQKNRLRKRVEQQAKRMQQAEKDRPNLLAQTVYMGRLGLLFVLPVIGGAYLGRWIDSIQSGYEMRWTLSLIFIGVFIGAVNLYLAIRE
ncbi:AtpZ/AtpI family protein [Marinobacterium lutimaris]|uniref:ATP synthase protein I n=1 Tax=Marinobacterium lutimaris TaxID=568106 RepID=A0A1H5X6D9_9GAMM|nr:AtpZ/AtpI family protein [Marinobacterium lutimaris]SEG07291.1 ATP synthase protein I [Marinobacterium lutimaris]